MSGHANLISESILVAETVDYLVSVGGRAAAPDIVEYVMNIKNAGEKLSLVLMQDIVERDARLSIEDDSVVLSERDHDLRELSGESFVVFDLETTGTKTPPGRVMEIGAYRVSDGKIEAEFQTLVDPEMPIPEFIASLTRINNEMVGKAPRFAEVLPGLLSFIGDSVLVAHNASFDLAFLNHEIGRVYQDARIANPWVCTVQIARRVLPDVENHKLKTLADHYSIDLVNHHRAGDDALATAHIFIRLLETMTANGISKLGSVRKFSQDKHYARPRKAAA